DIARAVDSERCNLFFGRAVENKRFAIRRDAIDQPAAIGTGNQVAFGLEGVVASALNAGASSRPPSLRNATPLAVPLVSSSNLDCSQVRVPSARANAERAEVERISTDSRASVLRAKVIPHFKQLFLLRAAAVCFQRQLQILNAMAVFYLVERIARYSNTSVQYSFQVVQIALPACNHGERDASHTSGNKEAAGDLGSNSS